MMKKSVSLLASLLLLLLLPLLTLAADPRKTLAVPNSVETKKTELIGPLSGQYIKIENVKAKHIQDLGKFAVDEHNKKTGDHLRYIEVDGGEKQIVSGINYKLQITAAKGGSLISYEAFIFESLKGILQLNSFLEIKLPGGYFPIKDVKTSYIQQLGKFAVDDHNIQKRENLKFNQVVAGASAVVAGTKYKLLLSATSGGLLADYLTVVFVNLKQIPQLTSFEHIVL